LQLYQKSSIYSKSVIFGYSLGTVKIVYKSKKSLKLIVLSLFYVKYKTFQKPFGILGCE